MSRVSLMNFYAIRELFLMKAFFYMAYSSLLIHSYMESSPNLPFSYSISAFLFRPHDYSTYRKYFFLIWNVFLYGRFLIMHSSILNFSPIQKHILSHMESFSPCIISYLECLIWGLHLVNKIFPFLYGMVFTILPFLYISVSSGVPSMLFLPFLSYFEFFLHICLSYVEVFPQMLPSPRSHGFFHI